MKPQEPKVYSLADVSGGQGTYCLMSIQGTDKLTSVPLVDARQYLKQGHSIVDWYNAGQSPSSSGHQDRDYFQHYTAMMRDSTEGVVYVPNEKLAEYKQNDYEVAK